MPRAKTTLKKYLIRPSPPFPANDYCKQKLPGNDGNMYLSKENKNGVCRWVKDPGSTKKTVTKKKSPKPRKPAGTLAKKYYDRPSPALPANEYCEQTREGNDGNMYTSKRNKNGVCRWVKDKEP